MNDSVVLDQQLIPPRSRTPTPRIPVALISTDVISRAGVTGQLRPRPEVLLLDDTETHQARVRVIIVDSVDETALRTLRALRSQGTPAQVLVVTHTDDAGLVAAVEHGITGIVRRNEASPERLVAVIRAAATGDGNLPPDLLGRLLHQVATVQRDMLRPRGLTFTGLRDREIEVLRLVADGYDTTEIAAKLSYSQRTIKNILHDVTNRLNLRNRCHAVAYALRNGLI
ncbi:response regulator transcription factor [Micromonospora sp. CPCC 206060]|uniref:response regulator transcription factor n=1 Tax=Micromonospora sp. CPCC 206060 TaxID=3122406 RepID=UPI002FF33057